MDIILAIQAVLAVLITLSILLQHRAAGFSPSFSGNTGAYVQRRGAEKLLYRMSMIMCVIFLALTVLHWYV